MSDNVTSFLEQRRKKRGGEPPSPPPPPVDGKTPYVAARVDRDRERQPCLIVRYTNGYVEVLPYMDLRRVLLFAPDGLTLYYPGGVVDVEGMNLEPLIEDFQQLRVIALTPYDAERFEPPEDGQTVITRLTWYNNEDIRRVSPEDVQPEAGA